MLHDFLCLFVQDIHNASITQFIHIQKDNLLPDSFHNYLCFLTQINHCVLYSCCIVFLNLLYLNEYTTVIPDTVVFRVEVA